MTGEDRITGGWGGQFWPWLALSLSAHVALGAWLISFQPAVQGAVELPSLAISVNLDATDVIDAVEQAADTAASSAGGTPGRPLEQIEPQEVVPEAEPPPPLKEAVKADREVVAKEAEPQRVAEAEPRPVKEAGAEPVAEEAITEEVETKEVSDDSLLLARAERKRKKEAEEKARAERVRAEAEARREQERRKVEAAEKAKAEARRKAAQRAKDRREEKLAKAQGGGGGARGQAAAKASAGRVSASRGSILSYGAMVRARIARNKPGGGARGNVVIALSISTSGSLQSARIVRSSGNPSLDQSALAAVRRSSPFPPPPQGATARQLRFTIPFQFR